MSEPITSPHVEHPTCCHCNRRPYWHHASNTSRQRERRCFMFSGCEHAESVGGTEKRNAQTYARIYDDPADWQRVNDAWAHLAEQLFNDYTATWSDVEKTCFRWALAGKQFIPGATLELNLP